MNSARWPNHMKSRSIIFWSLATLVWLVISYLYHPSIPTMLAGALLGFGLTALIAWSGSKIPAGRLWLVKVLLVSVMAGLMNVTALDVVYSLLAAPEGNRYILPVEMVASGLVFTLLVFARSRFGSQQEN